MKTHEIYSSTLGVRFLESAFQYVEAINAVSETSVKYPRVYLERHALELLLKAYIFQRIPKMKISCSGKDSFSLKLDSKQYKLKTHNLVTLYKLAIILDNKLLKDFEDTEEVMKQVKIWTGFDSDNERYKYPVSVNGNISRRNSNGDISNYGDIVPEIKPSSRGFYVLENGDNSEMISIKNMDPKLFEYSEFLRNQIQHLLNVLGNPKE
jgi:hypothetical protein